MMKITQEEKEDIKKKNDAAVVATTEIEDRKKQIAQAKELRKQNVDKNVIIEKNGRKITKERIGTEG